MTSKPSRSAKPRLQKSNRVASLPPATTTRERFVLSARRLLEEGGYAAASVQAIADGAGVSAGALYRHYPSKAELFVEVFRQAADAEIAAMHAATAVAGHVERVEAAVASFSSRALRRRRLSWALVYEPVDHLVDAERLVYRREYCRLLAALLRDAIAAGEIPEQNAELTAAALVGACAEALVGPLAPVAGELAADEEIIANLIGFCRRGIGAREGGRLRKVKG